MSFRKKKEKGGGEEGKRKLPAKYRSLAGTHRLRRKGKEEESNSPQKRKRGRIIDAGTFSFLSYDGKKKRKKGGVKKKKKKGSLWPTLTPTTIMREGGGREGGEKSKKKEGEKMSKIWL